jgi:hypothetical protein
VPLEEVKLQEQRPRKQAAMLAPDGIHPQGHLKHRQFVMQLAGAAVVFRATGKRQRPSVLSKGTIGKAG